MADELSQFNIPTLEAYNQPYTQFIEDGMFKSPTSALQSGMNAVPSIFGLSAMGVGPQADGVGNVTNTTQSSSKTSNNLLQALESVNKFYKQGMKGAYDGLPVLGSAEVRQKFNAYGQPYFTTGRVSGGEDITGKKWSTGETGTDVFGKQYEIGSQGQRMYDGKEESRLDAFKRSQVESAQKSLEASSTPAALEAERNKAAFRESKLQEGRNVIADIKGARSAYGADPETGVYDPRGSDTIARESTGLMKDDASRKAASSGAARMEAGQRYSDEMLKGLSKGMTPIAAMQAYRDYNNAQSMEKLYDKAGASLSPTGRVAFGKGGYAYTSDRKSTPESRAFMESEMQKKRKEMGV